VVGGFSLRYYNTIEFVFLQLLARGTVNSIRKIVDRLEVIKNSVRCPDVTSLVNAVGSISDTLESFCASVYHVLHLLGDQNEVIKEQVMESMQQALHGCIQLQLVVVAKALNHNVINPENTMLVCVRSLLLAVSIIVDAVDYMQGMLALDDNEMDEVPLGAEEMREAIIYILHYGRPLYRGDDVGEQLDQIPEDDQYGNMETNVPFTTTATYSTQDDNGGFESMSEEVTPRNVQYNFATPVEKKPTTHSFVSPMPTAATPTPAKQGSHYFASSIPTAATPTSSRQGSHYIFSPTPTAVTPTLTKPASLSFVSPMPTASTPTPTKPASHSFVSPTPTAAIPAPAPTPAPASAQVQAPTENLNKSLVDMTTAEFKEYCVTNGKPIPDSFSETNLPPFFENPPVKPAYKEGSDRDEYKAYMVRKYEYETWENKLVLYKIKLKKKLDEIK